MKRLEVPLYAALLALSLGAAWKTWKAEPPEARTRITIFDPAGAPITKIEWQGQAETTIIEFAESDGKTLAWVTAGRREEIQPPGTETPSPVSPHEAPVEEKAKETATEETPLPKAYGDLKLRSFPAGDPATALRDSFKPLKAMRQFTGLPASAVGSMGLADPRDRLAITAGGKTVAFKVGAKAYGTSDRYVQAESDNSIYLIESKVVAPLQNAETRLMERRPVTTASKEVAQIVLSTSRGGKSLSLVHQNRQDDANAFWTPPNRPDERNPAWDDLMEKLLTLRVTDYPLQGEAPDAEKIETVLEATLEGESGPLGAMALGRQGKEPPSGAEPPAYDYFVKSALTRGWVPVSRLTAGAIADGLESILQ